MSAEAEQRTLFDAPDHSVGLADVPPEHAMLAAQMPPGVRLGTMSWSYPGWTGIVYRGPVTRDRLVREGLTAFAKHPLLRAVEIDRTYYGPLSAEALSAFADQVPDDFRFLVKAHEDCTTIRFPGHPRHGKKAGMINARYLDAGYATSAVVAPFCEGLGPKGGVLLFQFPPQDAGEPRAFAHRVHKFLAQLPKGVPYAIELRNRELLTTEYTAALEDTGAVHCHNRWTAMPTVVEQIKRIPVRARRPLLIRWLLRPEETYDDARARYLPFDRLVREDDATRGLIADLVSRAEARGVPVLVFVDNKAEGCAPESIVRLARAIVHKSASR